MGIIDQISDKAWNLRRTVVSTGLDTVTAVTTPSANAFTVSEQKWSYKIVGLFTTASATATVEVYAYPNGSTFGVLVDTITLTASASVTVVDGATTYYLSNAEIVSLSGYGKADYYVTAVSAGTVKVYDMGYNV